MRDTLTLNRARLGVRSVERSGTDAGAERGHQLSSPLWRPAANEEFLE